MPAPIALFAFNRPLHLARTIASLRAARLAGDSDLWVFCDGPRRAADEAAVREVRRVAAGIDGFASVHVVGRDANAGLAGSIMAGVKQLCDSEGRVVVLEDDLAVAPGFLEFMNRALDRYAGDESVMQVCGFMFPVDHPERLPQSFFLRQTTSWGWATWARAWRHMRVDPGALLAELDADGQAAAFDLNGSYPYRALLEAQARGEVDSWAVLWYASVFLKSGLCLWPRYSLIRNEGQDGSGTHGVQARAAPATLWDNAPIDLPAGSNPCREAQLEIERYLRRQRPGVFSRIAARVRALVPVPERD